MQRTVGRSGSAGNSCGGCGCITLLILLSAWLVVVPLYRRATHPDGLTDEVIRSAQNGDLKTVAATFTYTDRAFQALLKHAPGLAFKRDSNGATLLHWAAKDGNRKMVMQLIAMKADMNARDSTGQTPLHMSVTNSNNAEISKLLIDAGAEVNARDNAGKMPMHNAVTADSVNLLAAHNADVNARDNTGKTALFFVSPVAAAALLNYHADVNARDNMGQTPLHAAVIRGSESVANVLISKGANVNARDNDGKTPLHYVEKTEWLLAIFLREHGANGSIKDNNGQRPLCWKREMVCTCIAYKSHGGTLGDEVGENYVPLGLRCGQDICDTSRAVLR